MDTFCSCDYAPGAVIPVKDLGNPRCEQCGGRLAQATIDRYSLDFTDHKFTIKDSGKREEFASGMVRDVAGEKVDYTTILDGPMFDRWAEHLSKAKTKYPDASPGVANWTLANGMGEYIRAKKSAFRHFRQWIRGDRDEDHAAAVYFNINLAEYVKGRLINQKFDGVKGK